MNQSLDDLSEVMRGTISDFLVQLRRSLADGNFLREFLYTVDESRLAGNTHHYWIRLARPAHAEQLIDNRLPSSISKSAAAWLRRQLHRNVIGRYPSEYSTLIKIPFSIPLSEVAEERTRRVANAITQSLPSVTPYAISHHEINRLLKAIGTLPPLPSDDEADQLLVRYGRTSIVKARARFPETWDELRGHYVLDSRGARLARKLTLELIDRKLLNEFSKFVDIGSGVGTMLFAVNRHSRAHATGVERHAGLARISGVATRRLYRLGTLDPSRMDLCVGDAFDARIIDLSKFDVLYVYSPIGAWEIDIDDVVERARVGAIVIFNRLPQRLRHAVTELEPVAGLFSFQKTAEPSPESTSRR